MSRETITLDNFANYQGEINNVEIRSHMPFPQYVPTAEILINLGHIASIARMGRLQQVQFGLYDKETRPNELPDRTHQYRLVAHEKSGRQPEIRSLSGVSHDSEDCFGFPRGNSIIKVNVGHSDLDNITLRDPYPWADLLDRGMRDGLVKASRKQLLQPRARRAYTFGVRNTARGIAGAILAAATQEPAMIPSLYAMCAADDGLNASGRLAAAMRKHPQADEEISAFKYLPVDRVVLTRIVANMEDLVVAI